MRTSRTRRYRFAASHRLHIHGLSEEENSRLYGKCNNPFGHGHDYILEVTVEGPVDHETGLIVPLSELDALVQGHVLRLFKDRNINLDVPQFRELVPTTENIAKVIAELVCQNWGAYISGSGRPRRAHVQETDRNGFEVWIPSGVGNSDAENERLKVAV